MCVRVCARAAFRFHFDIISKLNLIEQIEQICFLHLFDLFFIKNFLVLRVLVFCFWFDGYKMDLDFVRFIYLHSHICLTMF